MFVDTHTHLYLDEFSSESSATVDRAISAGVRKMIFPNVDLSTVYGMKALHQKFPENTYMAMGLHPTEIDEKWEEKIAEIKAEITDFPKEYVAIGEIGIDLYWDKTYREEQMKAFKLQCEWATDYNLPIIIHCREGLNETLSVLDGLKTKPRGVFHSFGGSVEDVEKIRRRGDYYFGINGIVTFKNSHLTDTLPAIGLERIVLETDSPYLAPVPYRGKRNESSYLPLVAEKIAEVFGASIEDVATVTTANAENLFSI